MTEEPREEGMTKKVVSRRDFLKYAGLAGGTIAAAGGLGGLVAACGGDNHHDHRRHHGDHRRRTTAAGGATTTAVSTGGEAAGAGQDHDRRGAPDLRRERHLRAGPLRPRLPPVGGRDQRRGRPRSRRQETAHRTTRSTTTRATSTPACVCSPSSWKRTRSTSSSCRAARRSCSRPPASDQRSQLHRHERRGWGHYARAQDEGHALVLPVPELLEPLPDAGVRRHPAGNRRDHLLHHLPRRPARHRVQQPGPGLPRRAPASRSSAAPRSRPA